MAATAVIEYQWKGYTPPNDSQAWDIQAMITHAERVITATGSQLLADLRQELEEAGLRKVGACIADKYSQPGRGWSPRWREVWKHKDQIGPEALGIPAVYGKPGKMERKEDMGQYDEAVRELASKASQKHPELGERAEKAAELVRKGHVQHQGGSRFVVVSQDGKRQYFVDTEARRCTCRDYKWAPVACKAPMCKHRLACLMLVKLDPHVSLAQPRARAGALAVEAARQGAAILI